MGSTSDAASKTYYDSSNHYDLLWGSDNIHLGYFPHLHEKTKVVLSLPQAGSALTERMISVGRIDYSSSVLDLGCGKGLACLEIAEQTGAACTGVDLSSTNIERADEIAKSNPSLKLEFMEGSFTEIPKALIGRKFTHIWSQVAFCHVHQKLPEIMREVKKVLAPGGVVVLNEYLGSDSEVDEATKQHVYKRLCFDTLHGHRAWRKIVEDEGFVIEHYENLDRDMAATYRELSKGARKHGFKSADGSCLGENYAETAVAVERRQIGMNLAILSLPPDVTGTA